MISLPRNAEYAEHVAGRDLETVFQTAKRANWRERETEIETAKYPHEIREDSLRSTQHDTGGRSHIDAPETGALRRKGAETVAIRCLL